MEETIKYKIQNYTVTEYLGKSIFVIEKVFDKIFCNQMIHMMDESNKNKLFFSQGNNVECFKILDFNDDDIIEFINQKIKNIFEIISGLKNFKVTGHTDFELRMVYGETRNHMDGICSDIIKHPTKDYFLKGIRSVTLVGVFNDDYDGGIYSFPNQKIQVKLKQGECIVFPPYWTHRHEVSKIYKKENGRDHRYIVSSWGLDDFLI